MPPPRLKHLRPPRRPPPPTPAQSRPKPSNVNVSFPYQPSRPHRRASLAGGCCKRLLLDRPSLPDRRKAEADGDRKPHDPARLQAGADADAETRTGVV